MVSGLDTATDSVYVPPCTSIVSPAEAALTAAEMVVKSQPVEHTDTVVVAAEAGPAISAPATRAPGTRTATRARERRESVEGIFTDNLSSGGLNRDTGPW